MARSIAMDPFLAHNFALIDIPVQALLPTAFPIKLLQSALTTGTFIGFSRISFPQLSIETKTIKEGNWPILHKILTGFTDGGEVQLEQAVLSINADMYFWFEQARWGRIAPRRHFLVIHTRADKRIPQRLLYLEGCIPTGWKPGSDLAGMSSEVVVETLTMSVTTASIIPLPVPTAKPNMPSFPNV